MTVITDFDKTLFRFINGRCTADFLDGVMFAFSVIGYGIVFSVTGLLLIALGFRLGNVRLRRAGYAGLIAIAGAGVVTALLKRIWERPRPLLTMTDVRTAGEHFLANSFPSGHTASAFAFALAVSAVYPKTRPYLLTLAFVIGLSRIYLGSHFPVDVVFGGVFGAIVGAAVGKVFADHEEPEEPAEE